MWREVLVCAYKLVGYVFAVTPFGSNIFCVINLQLIFSGCKYSYD